MTQCLEDVYLPSFIERRRPIGDILPTTSEEDHSFSAPKATRLVVAAVVLVGASSYLRYWASPALPSILQPGFGAMALYRWFGFHRVAP